MDSIVVQVFDEEITQDSTWLEQRTSTIEGQTQGARPEKVIYAFHFKTSHYQTLEEKLADMDNNYVYYANNEEKELLALGYTLNADYGFDHYDITGWALDEYGNGDVTLHPLVNFFTNWRSDLSNMWMYEVSENILDCTEAKLEREGLNNNVSVGLQLPTPIMERTVFVNPNYDAWQLLTDTEINDPNNAALGPPGSGNTGGDMGNYYSHRDGPSMRNGLGARWAYGLLLPHWPLAAGSNGYNIPGGGTNPDPYAPPFPPPLPPTDMGWYIPDPNEPNLFYTQNFYLRYETSMRAFNLYRDTWHAYYQSGSRNWNGELAYGNPVDGVCGYFSYQNTYVPGEGRRAPGFFMLADYSGDYQVSAAYGLQSIFPQRPDQRLLDRLNFTVE